MTPGVLLAYVVVAFICGAIAEAIGKSKGRSGDFWLGLILGVIGVFIVAVMPASKEGMLQREQARLRAQEEAQQRLDAEKDREYKP